MDDDTRRMYIIFESIHRDSYYVENFVNINDKTNCQFEKLNNSIVKLEENLNLFKIWVKFNIYHEFLSMSYKNYVNESLLSNKMKNM